MTWPYVAVTLPPCARDAALDLALVGALNLVALALLLVSIFIYNTTFHPLAKIPGPRLAAWSTIWLALHAKYGRLGELGRTLHRQYGPAVRVAPNQVWFDSKAAFKTIYRASRETLTTPFLSCADLFFFNPNRPWERL